MILSVAGAAFVACASVSVAGAAFAFAERRWGLFGTCAAATVACIAMATSCLTEVFR